MPVGHICSPLPGTHAGVSPKDCHLHDPCQQAVIGRMPKQWLKLSCKLEKNGGQGASREVTKIYHDTYIISGCVRITQR